MRQSPAAKIPSVFVRQSSPAIINPYSSKSATDLKASETWLRGFYDADYVITDSFHACVFAILFKKQFLVVGNKKRGMSRFESLLKQFGLEGRLVDEYVNIETIDDIDYDVV